MEITHEYQSLIETIIRNNNRYSGNEDLFEDFCSETIKRSYKIISSINNINNLESYLNKVATSAILEVLKTSGRLRRATQGYVQTREIPVSSTGVYKMDESGDILYDIEDPAPHFEEKILNKDSLSKIYQAIVEMDSIHAEKDFLNIFNLRFVKNLKQAEIAQELGISQGEVSKRLIELAKNIQQDINS